MENTDENTALIKPKKRRLRKTQLTKGVNHLLAALVKGRITDGMAYIDAQNAISVRYSASEFLAISNALSEAGFIKIETIRTRTRPKRIIRVLEAGKTIQYQYKAEQDTDNILVSDLARKIKEQYAI